MDEERRATEKRAESERLQTEITEQRSKISERADVMFWAYCIIVFFV